MYQNVMDRQGYPVKNLYCNNDGEYKRIKYQDCNYVMKLNGDKVDLYYYPDKFVTPIHSTENEICQDFYVDEEVDRCFKRNFERNKKTNFAERKKDSEAILKDLQDSIARGSKRAIKNFYDYAMANKWEYFCTFTFSNEKIRNNNDLLYLSYENFRRQLRRKNPDVKSLTVYEEFEKGGYHLHSLIGNVDLNLKPARHDNTKEFIYNSSGVQIFNCIDWNIGWNTIACIDPKSANEQVVNYMSKYMTKCSPAPPGCKRYFRSNNLESRQTVVSYERDIIKVIDSLGLKPFKKTDNCIYFSNYSNLSIDLDLSSLKIDENLSNYSQRYGFANSLLCFTILLKQPTNDKNTPYIRRIAVFRKLLNSPRLSHHCEDKL